MKRRSQQEPPRQPIKQVSPILHGNQQLQELNKIRFQLKELKQRNEQIEAQIKISNQKNIIKKNTNNNLRQTFKKLCDEIQILKIEHLTKVEQKLKSEEGPVSDLIKENGFGLSPIALMKIPSFRYQKKEESDICMGCYQELQHNSKCKVLASCEHCFHSQCLDQYLLVTKQCPACGVEVNL